MEVISHALNTGVRMLDPIDNEREVLHYESTGSLRILGPCFVAVKVGPTDPNRYLC
jgi:hypothetical protein